MAITWSTCDHPRLVHERYTNRNQQHPNKIAACFYHKTRLQYQNAITIHKFLLSRRYTKILIGSHRLHTIMHLDVMIIHVDLLTAGVGAKRSQSSKAIPLGTS